MSQCLGITVMPEYIQTEGTLPLLDNLIGRAGVTAVATSPAYPIAARSACASTRTAASRARTSSLMAAP